VIEHEAKTFNKKKWEAIGKIVTYHGGIPMTLESILKMRRDIFDVKRVTFGVVIKERGTNLVEAAF